MQRPDRLFCVMYIKHVSFDDLSPSLADDQARSLKQMNKPITFNNAFLHIPPQFNPLYVDPSLRDDGRHGSLPNGSSAREIPSGNANRLAQSMDMGFSPSQQDINVAFKNILGKAISTDNSEPAFVAGLGRTKSGMSSVSSDSNSLTRSPTRASSARLPPPPALSVLRRKSNDSSTADSTEDVDLTMINSQLEKQIEKETTSNTQINSGNKYGARYTTSAFANLNELEDQLINNDSDNEPEKKKKSYVDMSDEELAAIEKQLQSGGRQTHTDFNHFDFGQQNTLFIGSLQSKPPLHSRVSNISQKNQDPGLTYPSRPSVTHKAISITRSHKDYNRMYQDSSSSRTVVCYLNGRRHTWASADWFITECAKDGDHLVIVTNLPMYEELQTMLKKNFHEEHNSTRNKLEEFSFDATIKNKAPSAVLEPNFQQIGLMINELDELTKYKCERMADYYASRCKNKIMKVTVEVVKEVNNKFFVVHVLDLYKPNLQIVSTVSTNFCIKFRNGHVKLPNFLARHFWVPTIVIPFEFIDPRHLGKFGTSSTPRPGVTGKKQRIEMLDRCINKSLNDCLGKTSYPSNPIDYGNDDHQDMLSVNSEPEEDVTDYFPTSPEFIYKKQQLDKLGYIPPQPTRINSNNLNSTQSRTSSKSSRRSSRVYFAEEPGMYKVKSLLNEPSDIPAAVRKTKSQGHLSVNSNTFSSQSSKHSQPPSTLPSMKKNVSSNKIIHSTSNSVSNTTAKNSSDQKPKTKLGGLFKKLIGGKS